MPRKLLFVINNLHCGGAENSLVSLLQQLDYTRFEVDLLLFQKEGLFLGNVPPQVRILGPLEAFSYFDGPFAQTMIRALLRFRWDIAYAKIRFIRLRKHPNQAVREQLFWKYLGRCLPNLKGHYDVAIGFLEKTPNYFVVDKVTATKKIGSVRTDYEAMGMLSGIDEPYFKKLDHIVANSENATESLKKIFPQFASKVVLVENFFSAETLYAMAEEPVSLPDAALTIVSVGRLHPVKGYDLAIQACALIRDAGVDVRWVVLGEGAERANLERQIAHLGLQDRFLLRGMVSNPHPYVKRANMFVVTSQFEGKSRAIEEAKILKKLIVITRFPGIENQIQHGKNGLIVERDPAELAKAILLLHNDPEQQVSIRQFVNAQEHSNSTQLKALYNLIN